MKWLLWREFRLNRLILITGAVILLLPYVFVLGALMWPDGPTERARVANSQMEYNEYRARKASTGFLGAAAFSLAISHLTIVLLGGNAIAGERADRSAEFIAYLPLPRKRLLFGKLIMAFFTTAVVCGVNLFVLWFLWILVPEQIVRGPMPSAVEIVLGILLGTSTGLVLYGASWFISSIQSSPTFAVLGGLVTPMIVLGGLYTAAWRMGLPDSFLPYGYTIICITLAIVGFSIGTGYYLRRVEP